MKKILSLNNLIKITFVILLFTFTRGTVVGDQEKILSFVNFYMANNFSITDFFFKNSGTCDLYDKCNFNYLNHHFIWFFYLLFLNNIINVIELLLNVNFYNFEKDYIISLFDTSVFILSFIFIFKYLRKFHCSQKSFISVGFVFFASYGINFINGGFAELLLLFLIALKIQLKPINTKQIFIVSLIDIFLVSIKLYSIFFILLYLPLHFYNKKKFYYRYFLFFGFFFFCLFLIKINLPSNLLNYYQEGINIDLLGIIDRLISFYFSFTVGLLITFPIIFLLIFNLNKILAYKFIIIISLSLIFCLYKDLAFWGGAGIAGSRYIFPFLLIFIPDIVQIIRGNKIKVLFVFFVLLYTPTIYFKNTNILIVPETTGKNIINKVRDFPHYNFLLNPITVGWKSYYFQNILSNKDFFINVNNNKFKIEHIMPDTVISKINFTLNRDLTLYAENYRYEVTIDKFKNRYSILYNHPNLFAFINLLSTILYLLIITYYALYNKK